MTHALGTRLLLVDDDLKLCRLIREYLEGLGYSVTTAHTGPMVCRQRQPASSMP